MQLEDQGAPIGFTPAESFNSILVQLEAAQGYYALSSNTTFQFHIGAIRRRCAAVSDGGVTCFNSILVQLEENQASYYCACRACFNSILVQLEAADVATACFSLQSFNSILVQLEVGQQGRCPLLFLVSIPYWCN